VQIVRIEVLSAITSATLPNPAVLLIKRRRCATPGPTSAPRSALCGPPGVRRATHAGRADQYELTTCNRQLGAARLPQRVDVPVPADVTGAQAGGAIVGGAQYRSCVATSA
jgi:hypothetical protein